jgi:acyl-[acyl carrier protein]--UDP-N-acetylglucosamine O-acyltransferase
MTNEEIQRVMEFIIKQQESFSENMGQMLELHGQSEKRISRLETATVNLYNATTELNRAQKTLTERMAELAEAQAHTDQRVNVLIDIIEQGRNGESKA